MNHEKAISIEEHKKIQLDILRAVASFCEERKIRYFLADGTLIGAIRHKGFIPWDDDIDIEMPRPDYNRFKNEFCSRDNLRFVEAAESDSRYHNGKVIRIDTVKIEEGVRYNNNYLGVDIDVFIIDGCPEGEDEYHRLRKKINKLYNAYAQLKCGFTGSAIHIIKILLWRLIYGPPKRIIKKAFKMCELYDFNNSKYIARYGRFSLGFRVPAECYSTYKYAEFEGYSFRIPIGFDTILRAQFGDYMQLPPKEEQVTHHRSNVFWKG